MHELVKQGRTPFALLSGVGLAMAASAVLAQTPPPAPAPTPNGEELQEVVVTGSRVVTW